MDWNNRLAPSVLEWIRNSDVDELTHNLEDVLRQNQEAAYASIRWRPNIVTDFRDLEVQVNVQRLARWDSRHPDIIFEHGFVPVRTEEWVHEEMDLWTHVQRHVPSIFVSTTVVYNNNGRTYWWTPRNRNNMWAYEIFATGGIDVNLSLGHHNYENQREIAFPGGIRPEYIRTARQYDENGNVIATWANGGFIAGPGTSLAQFPDPICSARVRAVFWTGANATHRVRRELLPSSAAPDFMEDGEVATDPFAGASFKPPKASFIIPGTTNEAYFFGGPHCVRIKRVPGSPKDVILTGPTTIRDEFLSLKSSNFAKVDAVLPSFKQNGESYVFSGEMYVLIKVDPKSHNPQLIKGPSRITDEWASLRQAGFSTVDAVLPSPTNIHEAYFFSGHDYAHVNITLQDYVIKGPKKIVDNWPSLKQAGFPTIDSALPSPNGNGEAYFFSGEQYVLVKVIPGTTNDSIIRGPTMVTDGWPVLIKPCRVPLRPPRASFIIPGTKNEAYFFGWTQCTRIRVAPGTTNDVLLTGPTPIRDEFLSLKSSNFAKVDAVLPSFKQNGETYVFSGEMYVLIKVDPTSHNSQLIRGPLRITDEWASLRQAGFSTVDAVLPSPTNINEAYFFSGQDYVLVNITLQDYVINGPKKIVDNWPSLKQAGFPTIDSALPSPNGNGEAYFFSGEQYVLVKVIPGTTNDSIIRGPTMVTDGWPVLHAARLY